MTILTNRWHFVKLFFKWLKIYLNNIWIKIQIAFQIFFSNEFWKKKNIFIMKNNLRQKFAVRPTDIQQHQQKPIAINTLISVWYSILEFPLYCISNLLHSISIQGNWILISLRLFRKCKKKIKSNQQQHSVYCIVCNIEQTDLTIIRTQLEQLFILRI